MAEPVLLSSHDPAFMLRAVTPNSLDPKFAPPVPSTATTLFGRLGLDDDEQQEELLGCWPDYSIRIRR
jgi:hypothetical protein